MKLQNIKNKLDSDKEKLSKELKEFERLKGKNRVQ